MTKKNQKSQKENTAVVQTTSHDTAPVWLQSATNGVILAIHAQPGAKRDAVVGEYNNRLKLSLKAPPVDGKANAKLTEFLADTLGVSKSMVRVISGETQRTKRVAVSGIDLATTISRLKESVS